MFSHPWSATVGGLGYATCVQQEWWDVFDLNAGFQPACSASKGFSSVNIALPLVRSLSLLQHVVGGGRPSAAGTRSQTPTDPHRRQAPGWEHSGEPAAPPSPHRPAGTHKPPPAAAMTYSRGKAAERAHFFTGRQTGHRCFWISFREWSLNKKKGRSQAPLQCREFVSAEWIHILHTNALKVNGLIDRDIAICTT